MDRRAFIRALGIAGAAFKAAGMLPTSPAVLDEALSAPLAPDVLGAGVRTSEALLDVEDCVYLPTEGLEEVNVSLWREPIEITSPFDEFEQYSVGLTQTDVELLYVTDNPIQMLMQPIVSGARCRLEAFGWRIDGFLVVVEPAGGDPRGNIVTTVKMRATGYCEYDVDKFDHEPRGIAR